MGLDMYLYAKKYLSSWQPEGKELALAQKIRGSLDPKSRELIEQHKEFGGTQIEFTIGYWRKANAIHAWFVDNVQDGRDECQESYVDSAHLEQLKTIVKQLVESKDETQARELLPTKAGFFFGSTEFNEWYWEDLEATLPIIERAQHLIELGWDIHYHSSW